VRLSADLDRILTGFTLTLDHHFVLADGVTVQLTNTEGQTASLDLLVDFPDTPLDLREVWGHVTPFGMALDRTRQFLYVADAGQNRVIGVDVNTGRSETLVRFPRIPRVLVIPTATETDPVPTSARFYGEGLLVTFLSGAPFAQGSAAVRIVNPATGDVGQFINLLTTSTDLLVRDSPTGAQFWVLEYRHNLVGALNTGRVLQFDAPLGRVIADQLQGPTGMAQDPTTGDIFVAETGGGRITQIRLR
jgi:DNA-binding beta-propeller fold protein YncE